MYILKKLTCNVFVLIQAWCNKKKIETAMEKMTGTTGEKLMKIFLKQETNLVNLTVNPLFLVSNTPSKGTSLHLL